MASFPIQDNAWTRALVALRTVASAGAEWEAAMDAVERAGLLDETLVEAARARHEVEACRGDPERTRAFELLVRAIASRHARRKATRSMRLLDAMLRESPKAAAQRLKGALMGVEEAAEDVDVQRWQHADVFRIASETVRGSRRRTPVVEPGTMERIPPHEFVEEVQALWSTLDPEQKKSDAGVKVKKILDAARTLQERIEEGEED